MDVETYALEFLRSRGFQVSGTDGDLVPAAADTLCDELLGMQLKLADLRGMAAMAQFSSREMRPDVLRLIEETGSMPGDVWVSMDATSVKVVGERKAAQ